MKEDIPGSISSLPGVAVFGSSTAAKWTIRVLQENGFSVKAIWARSNLEAESTAQSFNIPFHTSIVDDVLLRRDVGLVVILTPPSLHSQIAVKALGIGKHVLCGVPGGLNQGECLRMMQAAQYYPSLMAALAYSLRHLPSIVILKNMISTGYLGENISLMDVRINCASLIDTDYSWSCDSGMGGGVLTLLGSHLIDLITFLDLGKVIRVHATLHTMTKTTDNIRGIRQITSDDVAVLQLHLSGGTFVTVTINSCLSDFSQEITLCGGAGHLTASQADLKGRKKGASKDEIFHLCSEPMEHNTGLNFLHAFGMRRMIGTLKSEFNARKDRPDLRDQNNVAATFKEGFYVQAIIEALKRSSEKREWRKVELLQDEGGVLESH